MFLIRSLVPVLCGFFIFSSTQAAPVTIKFDSLSGMINSPGTHVPLASQLSDQFRSTLGVSFRSRSNYVAVVNHISSTPSLPNVIGGVKLNGSLSYGTPITISFFDPSNPAVKGTTDLVSIRGDMAPLSGASATMEAFDVLGHSLGSVSAADSAVGLTLSMRVQGIHSLVLTQNSASGSVDGTIGFDNLRFNTVIPSPVSCRGLNATIIGTIGDDLLIGTDGDDVIVGFEGHDTIYGLGGNDVICGGPGNDILLGGDGDDLLDGGLSRDALFGDAGHDQLMGGGGNDYLNGGDGDDVLNGGSGIDVCDGGPHSAGGYGAYLLRTRIGAQRALEGVRRCGVPRHTGPN